MKQAKKSMKGGGTVLSVVLGVVLGVGFGIPKAFGEKISSWPPCSAQKCQEKILGWQGKALVAYRNCFRANYPARCAQMAGGCPPKGFSWVYSEVVRRFPNGKAQKLLCRTRKKRRKRPLYKRSGCKRKLQKIRPSAHVLSRKRIYAGFRMVRVSRGKGKRSLSVRAQRPVFPKMRKIGEVDLATVLQGSKSYWSWGMKQEIAAVHFSSGLGAVAVKIRALRTSSSAGSFLRMERWVVGPLPWSRKDKKILKKRILTPPSVYYSRYPKLPVASVYCRKHSDCVLRPRSPCDCPVCKEPRHVAINKRELRKIRHRWARMRCRRPKCAHCPPYKRKFRYRAKCVRRRCRVKHYRIKAK